VRLSLKSPENLVRLRPSWAGRDEFALWGRLEFSSPAQYEIEWEGTQANGNNSDNDNDWRPAGWQATTAEHLKVSFSL
jgi:hypothetical protein